jgi:hypothetical protein
VALIFGTCIAQGVLRICRELYGAHQWNGKETCPRENSAKATTNHFHGRIATLICAADRGPDFAWLENARSECRDPHLLSQLSIAFDGRLRLPLELRVFIAILEFSQDAA